MWRNSRIFFFGGGWRAWPDYTICSSSENEPKKFFWGCVHAISKFLKFLIVTISCSRMRLSTEGVTCCRVIFHFNWNNSKHVHAKVAPPRLSGDKMGVFATRSPHRPCPIGLSLVQIDMIEGKHYFLSVICVTFIRHFVEPQLEKKWTPNFCWLTRKILFYRWYFTIPQYYSANHLME